MSLTCVENFLEGPEVREFAPKMVNTKQVRDISNGKRCPKKNARFSNVVFPIVEKVFDMISKMSKTTTSPKIFFDIFCKKTEKRLNYGEINTFQKQNKNHKKM